MIESTDEYNGPVAKNFTDHRSPEVWPCSSDNKPPEEGGLMCCDKFDPNELYTPQSCCPGNDSINLFSIGSELGSPVTVFSSFTVTLASASASASLSSFSLWVFIHFDDVFFFFPFVHFVHTFHVSSSVEFFFGGVFFFNSLTSKIQIQIQIQSQKPKSAMICKLT